MPLFAAKAVCTIVQLVGQSGLQQVVACGHGKAGSLSFERCQGFLHKLGLGKQLMQMCFVMHM